MPSGGTIGNKGGGRKSLQEEAIAIIKKRNAEEISEDKLTKHLEVMKMTDRKGLREIALPIYLRSKAEKKQIDIGKTLEDILKKFGK